jgi:undecaprenyl-diphosphatase
MTWLQAVVLALLQGVTELFPISSLGHTILLTALLGWTDLQNSPSFLPFIVLFHVGTAAALFIYFWRDWVALIRAFLVTAVAGRIDADPNGRAAWLLVAGTIPTGLIGLFFQTPLKQLFSNPLVAAAFLTVNGVILLVGERARRRALATAPVAAGSDAESVPGRGRAAAQTAVAARPAAAAAGGLSSFATLGWRDATLVGLSQALALLPGISRSGVTMVAALRVGMGHEEAATYTFLLATPIIGAAGLLEIPQLAGSSSSTLVTAVVGGILAGVAAYLSTRFLMRYFEKGRLDPFGYYCIVAGLASLAFLAIHP